MKVLLLFVLFSVRAQEFDHGDLSSMPPSMQSALGEYVTFHREQLVDAAHRDAARVLVFRYKSYGGFADRMRGITFCLWLCILTKRVFLVDNLFEDLQTQLALVRPGLINPFLSTEMLRTYPANRSRTIGFVHRGAELLWKPWCGDHLPRIIFRETNEVAAKFGQSWSEMQEACGVSDSQLQLARDIASFCHVNRCSGLTFRILFGAGPGMSRTLALVRSSSAYMQASTNMLSPHGASETGFGALFVRAFDSTIVYKNANVTLLTTFRDSKQDNARMQAFADALQKMPACKKALFMASDSSVLIRIVTEVMSSSFIFHCCSEPYHVARASSREHRLQSWLQLFYDIEMGARADRMVHGDGGLQEMVRFWRSPGIGKRSFGLKETTTPEQLHGFLCADKSIA